MKSKTSLRVPTTLLLRRRLCFVPAQHLYCCTTQAPTERARLADKVRAYASSLFPVDGASSRRCVFFRLHLLTWFVAEYRTLGASCCFINLERTAAVTSSVLLRLQRLHDLCTYRCTDVTCQFTEYPLGFSHVHSFVVGLLLSQGWTAYYVVCTRLENNRCAMF